jgi:GNAT superfamily N-acetyltransferase
VTRPESADHPFIIEAADAHSEEVEGLIAAYFAEITGIFGYDPTHEVPTTPEDFTPPNGTFLVLRDSDGRGAGCGAVRMLDPTTAEIKRMWLHPSMRGRGAGALMLAALEAAAVELGASRGVLDTNGTLVTAIALYRGKGWVDVPPYNVNPEATHWFAKDLKPAD